MKDSSQLERDRPKNSQSQGTDHSQSGEKSQCLQGKPPCVALHTTQPSDFNTISWLPTADHNKIKTKAFQA